ncbi:MAG: HAMP domain-containing protein [Desulfobulbaceae bacterium]|nr:MAG: HAMP domain-containing protein [Desulfobulbaceae bacterium]
MNGIFPEPDAAVPRQETLPAKRIYTPEQLAQKRKIIRWVILVCLCIIPFSVWIQRAVLQHEEALPTGNNLLVFALLNLNVLLAIFVLFLVLRYLAELLFERRIKRIGSKLKTKLIISFLSLTLIPTILLFFVSLQFVSTSMDYWFNASIENSLQESLKMAQSLFHEAEDKVSQMSQGVESRLQQLELTTTNAIELNQSLEQILAFNAINGPDSLAIISDDNNLEISVVSPDLKDVQLPKIPVSLLRDVKASGKRRTTIEETPKGDLVLCISRIDIGRLPATLITSLLVDREQVTRMEMISQGLEGYRQLKHFKEPFKFWLLIILLIATLLIIFAAIWFGLYISRGITGPLEKLADATRRVADGDLEFEMESESDDEMGMLVNSFNTMTHKLGTSNRHLAEAHAALQASSQEAEQRRRYTEIILQSVSTGVISLDENGNITTFNRFAEKLLNIDSSVLIGRSYGEILPAPQAAIVAGFIDELNITGKTALEQHLKLNIMGRNYSLLVSFMRLTDDDSNPLGFVLVFDNLTKMEKMQRVAAWREVARRIAHEIKNPLTPIQLSAQRLRKRYPEILAEPDGIFDSCTSTIITQVDELKRLVSEFSQFARMPKIHRAPADLAKLTRETLFLYEQAHRSITFSCRESEPIPVFSFDAEQIKRCIINLLDNAVAVLPGGGTIDIELALSAEADSAIIRVSDNGPGISKENKAKLFEPYFSTKKAGTGLGLAIVSTIVADHNGYVRVLDNVPQGATFVIELPMTTTEPRKG